jgi:hypothetical protein
MVKVHIDETDAILTSKIASFISSSKIMGFVVLIFLSLYYYYFNNIITLFIVITCASSALVLLVSAFTRVETANSDQLDINQDQAPLLLKNARSLITENQQRYLYKPYSLFAQPLSHISEEVDEELDIVDTRESYFRFGHQFLRRNLQHRPVMHFAFSLLYKPRIHWQACLYPRMRMK